MKFKSNSIQNKFNSNFHQTSKKFNNFENWKVIKISRYILCKFIEPLSCIAVKNSMVAWTKKNGQMELQINCFVWNKIEFILWSLHYGRNYQYLSKNYGAVFDQFCPKIMGLFNLKSAKSIWISQTKGQLISEAIFLGFKSPKKQTKFLKDFCPSL